MASTQEGQSFGLEWKITRETGVATLALKGELDLASADVVGELADTLLAQDRVIIFDLEQLEFMDSTGLRLLGGVRRRAEQDGRRFLLARVSPAVRRILHVAGLVEYFEYVEGGPPAEKVCTSCHAWVPADASVCPECGAAS